MTDIDCYGLCLARWHAVVIGTYIYYIFPRLKLYERDGVDTLVGESPVAAVDTVGKCYIVGILIVEK